MMSEPMGNTTKLEKESLEAHVDLCALRYQNLDERLTKIESKVEDIHTDITNGNKSMVKVIVGAVGTVVAGLLSTIVVLLVNF
jgi:tetrahydromethanopterin S-methyltransferase subunit G